MAMCALNVCERKKLNMELGGFAETAEDIDGTQEEFEAFNYCLACDYLDAMLREDFEALGDVGLDTIESVVYWLNYDGEIGESIKEQIATIPQGYLVTDNKRPLFEAVIENNNYNFASIFIDNGNYDPRLFVVVMTQDPDFSKCEEVHFLNSIFKCKNGEIDLSTYINFLNSLFGILEEKYVSLECSEEKAKFLKRIKPHIAGIRIPPEFKRDLHMMEIIKMNTYSWQKELRCQK